jgi:hypothetical protein
MLDLSIVNGHVIDNTSLFRAGSTHAQPKLLFRNTTGRRFEEVGRRSGRGFATTGVGRSLVAADIDNDGDVDLVATNNGAAPDLLVNNGGMVGNALLVHLVGTRSNRDALGARLTVRAGGRTQMRELKSGSSYLGQSDVRVHFGLGQATVAEELRIRWPGGQTETVRDVPGGQVITVTEGRGVTARIRFVGR